MRFIIALAVFACACTHTPAQNEAPEETVAAVPVAQPEVLPFDAQTPPPAPDYSVAKSWAATANAPGASATRPAGLPVTEGAQQVDVFYIHPTTYKARDTWNQDLSIEEVNAWTDGSVIARQAGVFNECCRVFAPRYRQASLLATRDGTLAGDGGKAYELAYSDVARAFEYYLANENDGRPFIIAGHSQGALMSYWLVRDYVDGSPLQGRMVAAYIIGLDLVEGDFGRTYQTVSLCQKPEDTGCILAWNAVTPELDLEMMAGFVGGRYARVHNTNEGRVAICQNPLTFDADQPSAGASQSKGAVPGAPDESAVQALVPGKVAAHCEKGFLVVEADPSLGLQPLPGGSMHYHDFGLFYADIQANLRQRIAAFFAE